MLPIADETNLWGRDSYKEGVGARDLGYGRRDCPYSAGTMQQLDWLAGWHDEDWAMKSRGAGPLVRAERAA